ncbi:hypothetical protein ACLH2P_28405, partial [Klebsiella michiganensis]
LMMNPVPWLQMTNMISYQGLVRTFLSKQALIVKLQAMQAGEQDKKRRNALGRIIDEISNMVARRGKNNTVGTSGAEHNWDEPNSLLGSPQQPGTNKIH